MKSKSSVTRGWGQGHIICKGNFTFYKTKRKKGLIYSNQEQYHKEYEFIYKPYLHRIIRKSATLLNRCTFSVRIETAAIVFNRNLLFSALASDYTDLVHNTAPGTSGTEVNNGTVHIAKNFTWTLIVLVFLIV